jgi:starch-binding outer membrane protein, SusD/RagB family
MFKNKILCFSLILLIGAAGCKKQLNVGNPNSPRLSTDITTEASLAALGQGNVYEDGFAPDYAYNWLGSSYFSLNYSYSELLADMVGSTDANENVNIINTPYYAILDNSTPYVTAQGAANNEAQVTLLRTANTRAETAAGYNAFYYQWCNMYVLNGTMNTFLLVIPTVKGLSSDAISTMQAWAYFWKGYAYSVVGSQYTAGLIVDTASLVTGTSITNNNYLIRDSIIARSNYYYNLASTTLGSISAGSADYATIMGDLIPAAFQGTPHGGNGVFTPTMWQHNINTMLARNILVNKLSPFVNQSLSATITGASIPVMGSADWQNVLTLTTNGIQAGDAVFTATSSAVNSFYGNGTGTITLMAAGPNQDLVFQPGLRLCQNYNAGDQRLALDFTNLPADTFYNDYFSTVYSLIDGPNGSGGSVYDYSDQTTGDYELFIAGSYEENTLMLAEANIMTGNVNAGLTLVDAERTYQGANVAATANTGLTQAQAYNQLVRERRVALFGRGLSFWDSRRWGWIYDIKQGGGSYGNQLLYLPSQGASVMNYNATIDYNFMDYWDIPADEVVLNPPSSATAKVVTNPNY